MEKKGLLLVISGPAGSGKGTVTKQMLRESDAFGYSVSATTREPRPGEVDGADYHFISRAEFEEKIKNGEMLEYTQFCNGHLYGTLMEEAMRVIDEGRDLLLEIEVEGGLNVKRLYPDAVLIMLLPPAFSVQEARLRGRGTEEEDNIRARLQRAHEELDVLDRYDYIVYNQDDGIDACIADIRRIVEVEKMAVKRHPGLRDYYFTH